MEKKNTKCIKNNLINREIDKLTKNLIVFFSVEISCIFKKSFCYRHFRLIRFHTQLLLQREKLPLSLAKAFTDFTHKRFYTPKAFVYFTQYPNQFFSQSWAIDARFVRKAAIAFCRSFWRSHQETVAREKLK